MNPAIFTSIALICLILVWLELFLFLRPPCEPSQLLSPSIYPFIQLSIYLSVYYLSIYLSVFMLLFQESLEAILDYSMKTPFPLSLSLLPPSFLLIPTLSILPPSLLPFHPNPSLLPYHPLLPSLLFPLTALVIYDPHFPWGREVGGDLGAG